MIDDAATPPRILHFPTDVGGNPSGLARAERRLGAHSTVAVIHRSSLAYDVDVDLDLASSSRFHRTLRRAAFAVRCLHRYDLFHFNFAQTFLPRLGPFGVDLPLLRALGKRIFMTFQGCDVRRKDYCRDHYEISCCGNDSGPGLCRLHDDPAKERAVAYARRFAHRLFCLNPDLLNIIPDADFIPYASVDPADVSPVPARPDRKLTLIHAPTSRLIKGTDRILHVAEQLRSRFDIDWRLVEGLPHAEAMRQYRHADLAIDQLKVGWYGAFAVEMMALGKPVVCYIRDADLRHLPPAMAEELPVIRATPDSLLDVLSDLMHAPQRLVELGQRSRAFVQRWHDPLKIARRLLQLYRDPSLPFWN